MAGRCICGCGKRAVQQHHVVTRQELRRGWNELAVNLRHESVVKEAARWHRLRDLLEDERNLVPMAHHCHGAHHRRARPLPLHVLPDSVFEFAAELLGRERAHVYLGRYYAGGDPRHDALLVPAVPLSEADGASG